MQLQKLHVKETKVTKSTRGMPRLSEAMKDVVSCDKLRVEAHTRQSVDFRMGQPSYFIGIRRKAEANLLN
jgi:hypothetical protein